MRYEILYYDTVNSVQAKWCKYVISGETPWDVSSNHVSYSSYYSNMFFLMVYLFQGCAWSVHASWPQCVYLQIDTKATAKCTALTGSTSSYLFHKEK